MKADSADFLQLLILVSVSVPILKSIWFLKANVSGVEITFGAWGYCTASNCTTASLGYSLGECWECCWTSAVESGG